MCSGARPRCSGGSTCGANYNRVTTDDFLSAIHNVSRKRIDKGLSLRLLYIGIMWQKACDRMFYSVHAVLLKTPPAGNQPLRWDTIGSSFMISGKPDLFFITNAHVICDSSGNSLREENLALAVFLPGLRAI